ncbi:Glucan 1,3-beta-glucosidase [Zancudomyces culisetae]|uniref:glucan endo-1,3-beta-D-glucosidase n=1 Tax=Zancudomyces culisetae TaxID=1213189 RepID=A0A1R1PER3_ZANCU|nr:Glucan 1,3-beta-glucosidase [Zancudomyces culisetae]OMH83106.1 Glucan 1,3-beta-glucosidase [Zancudomyces culisetae]|eukprot:OMH79451.1 Glucan 1,3-beta-glucosidase [Zancudomyces culisetae]
MKFFNTGLFLSAIFTVSNADSRFNGLNYNPKRDANGCPSLDDVKSDLNVLSKYTDTLRIYSTVDCNAGEMLLKAIKGSPWKLYLGIWVGQDDNSYNADKDEIIRLSKLYDLKSYVKGVVVGSEAIYRKERTAEQMASLVSDTKSTLGSNGLGSIKVTSSETWPWYQTPLINAVDFLFVHVFPFWEGKTIEESSDVAFGHIYDLQKVAQGKKVVIAESGWPSAGDNYGASVASLTNAQKYMSDFVCRASAENIDYLYFSAIDAPWASTNNASNVESHWGIILSDHKTPKFSGNNWFDCTSAPKKPSNSTSTKTGSTQTSSSASNTSSQDSTVSSTLSSSATITPGIIVFVSTVVLSALASAIF